MHYLILKEYYLVRTSAVHRFTVKNGKFTRFSRMGVLPGSTVLKDFGCANLNSIVPIWQKKIVPNFSPKKNSKVAINQKHFAYVLVINICNARRFWFGLERYFFPTL